MGPLAVGDDAPPVILNYLQWWSGYPLAESLCQGRGRHIELTTPACLIFIYHSCETAFLHPTLSFKYLCSTSSHRQQWWHLASLALFFLMQKRRHYWLFQASLAGLLLGYWILQSTENTSLCGEKSRIVPTKSTQEQFTVAVANVSDQFLKMLSFAVLLSPPMSSITIEYKI